MNSNNEEDGYAVSNVDGDGAEAENEIDAKGSVFVDSTVYYVGAVNLEDEGYVFTYHHVIKVDAKDPTCTENGNIEYWYCDDCGKYFEDAGLTKEISQADTVLEKIAHKYENGVCKVCGAKDADYKPGDSNNGSDSDKKAPQTGDTAQVQLYLYAALISAATLAGVSALKKSRMK